MWPTFFVTVLGVVGVILNLLLAWPQVWRAAKHGTAGISNGTVLAGFLGRALWSAYAVRAHDLALFVGQAPVAIAFAAIAALVARERGAGTGLFLGTGIAISCATSAALALAVPDVLTVLAIVVAAVVSLPQMLRTLRSEADNSGVSVAMYWFTSAASATWMTYGIVNGDLAISMPHFLLLPTSIATAIAVQQRRRGR